MTKRAENTEKLIFEAPRILKNPEFLTEEENPNHSPSLNIIHLESIHDTLPKGGVSPNGGPLGFFIGRLDAGMKTGFILITHWNADFYSVPELGDEAGGRETKRPVVGPGFVSQYCLFVCHTGYKASAMPILASVFGKIATIEALGEVRCAVIRESERG